MSTKVTRLFTSFQPENYQLELEPDRETMRFTGKVTISGKKVGRPSQRLTFHQHDLQIRSAHIIKHDKKGDQVIAVARINSHKTFDEVRLHADAMLYSGQYTVTLEFEGTLTDAMHGMYPCYYEHEGSKKSLIATQFESHHAREAFPCIDEPEAKATFDLTLITPQNEDVLANTPAKNTEKRGQKLATIFETTPKMSTYLLAFVYGDLQYKEAKTKDGVVVRTWATKAQPADSLDFALDVAVRSIEFFNDYFGVPYPLAKCDHVALPDFSSGAMENWGLITYRESCLLAPPATTSQSTRELIATIITHETSHQWFGNLVTMRWWDNLWLNESFANVMEYVATDALFPEWQVWNTFITQEGLSAIRRDVIAGVQPVQTDVRHPDEISSLFDPSIVYAKGGRLLKMLMQYIGEANFRAGLKAYFTAHAYGSTTGDDLWKALGAASGKDIAAFMDPWLTRSGFPVVRVEQAGQQLNISQQHFLLDPAKADPDRVWPVPLLGDHADVSILLDAASAQYKLKTENYIRINQGALGHYVAQYAHPEHATAIAQLIDTQKLGVVERLMLLSDSAMLARGGQQSFVETLKLLEHYAQEDQEPVWDIMSLTLGDTKRFVDVDRTLEPPFKKMVRTLIQTQYERLGWQEKPGEDTQDTKLRALIIGTGVYAEHPAITAEALKLFERYKKDSQSVAAELRSIVFGAAMRHGAGGAFDYLLELDEQTNNADLKQDIASGLTDTRDPEQATRLLARLKDAQKVRPQDIARWVVYLLRNRYTREQAWDWLRANWQWIEETFAGDKYYDTFPRYAANCFSTQKLLDEYKAFFEPKINDVAISRNIAMGIEELENRVAWLKRDLASVQKYLQKSA